LPWLPRCRQLPRTRGWAVRKLPAPDFPRLRARSWSPHRWFLPPLAPASLRASEPASLDRQAMPRPARRRYDGNPAFVLNVPSGVANFSSLVFFCLLTVIWYGSPVSAQPSRHVSLAASLASKQVLMLVVGTLVICVSSDCAAQLNLQRVRRQAQQLACSGVTSRFTLAPVAACLPVPLNVVPAERT